MLMGINWVTVMEKLMEKLMETLRLMGIEMETVMVTD